MSAFSKEYRREVLFEFVQIGTALKVTAVDSHTGTEVSIVGDPHASQAELEAVAHAKLKRALGENETPGSKRGLLC